MNSSVIIGVEELENVIESPFLLDFQISNDNFAPRPAQHVLVALEPGWHFEVVDYAVEVQVHFLIKSGNFFFIQVLLLIVNIHYAPYIFIFLPFRISANNKAVLIQTGTSHAHSIKERLCFFW